MVISLLPGCFYAMPVTGAALFFLPFAHIELGDRGAFFLWTAVSVVVAPFFIADHADRIAEALGQLY